jgi:hypothetical protein
MELGHCHAVPNNDLDCIYDQVEARLHPDHAGASGIPSKLNTIFGGRGAGLY